MHVVDATQPSRRGWTREPEIENARIELEEQKRHIESLGPVVKVQLSVITTGDVTSAILAEAEREHVSLIVVGARGKGLIEGVLVGSVSQSVLRYAKTSVLVMRHKVLEGIAGGQYEKFCPNILSKVLFPTDFSEPSDAALSVLKEMSGIGKVVLVHVITRGETHEEIKDAVREATDKLEAIRRDLAQVGLVAEPHVRIGSPTDEITLLAEKEDVSLVMISSHGKGWIQQLMVGSTTYLVAKRSKRPVLVVRTRHTA